MTHTVKLPNYTYSDVQIIFFFLKVNFIKFDTHIFDKNFVAGKNFNYGISFSSAFEEIFSIFFFDKFL